MEERWRKLHPLSPKGRMEFGTIFVRKFLSTTRKIFLKITDVKRGEKRERYVYSSVSRFLPSRTGSSVSPGRLDPDFGSWATGVEFSGRRRPVVTGYQGDFPIRQLGIYKSLSFRSLLRLSTSPSLLDDGMPLVTQSSRLLRERGGSRWVTQYRLSDKDPVPERSLIHSTRDGGDSFLFWSKRVA